MQPLVLALTLSQLSCSKAVIEMGDDSAIGPTAVALATPQTGVVPLDVTLSGADSTAGSQPIAQLEWTLPDSSVVEGETVDTTLLTAGTHSFTLTVVDAHGQLAEASVEVQASAPIETDCPSFADASVAGTMRWGEVSGLASASWEGVLWAHSDAQGNGAEVYAISTEAALLGTFLLEDIEEYDWEDIARGPGPVEGVSYLYIADTGDNSERRSSVTVVRFEEPSDVTGGTIRGAETIELTYPDGARDCETLLVDPLTGDLVLIERDRANEGVSGIYVAEAPLSVSQVTELSHEGTLVFGEAPLTGDVDTTGGDVSPDGELVLVRTHDRVWSFARDPARPLHSAFESPVCATPEVDEAKGEAVTFAWDSSGYYTGGEEDNQPLHWYGVQ